jgi:nucleoside-diphosphate-sugar epimerase
MTKPRVLIVGATGRTGGSIVDGLLEAGETVRGYNFLTPASTLLTRYSLGS